jgi:tRNA-modifying protein YgfZ
VEEILALCLGAILDLVSTTWLIDRSERGKLALTGSEAKSFLQGQLTNDIEALEPGTGCYAAFLTNKGKMLGDVRVLDLGDEIWLDTERVALQALFNMIRRSILGADVDLHKRTVECGLLSLVGPSSRDVAGASVLLDEEEHANVRGSVGGAPVVFVATDVGVDVICDSAATDAVRAALVEAGAEEGSEEAGELVRIERGRPRYGVDMTDATMPQEAGINERAVSFSKGCYVGQETVARLHYRGKPNRHLRGLRLTAPAAPGDPVVLGEKEVGVVSSAAVSPTHGPIALALVRREAEPGAEVRVGDTPATVAELPF